MIDLGILGRMELSRAGTEVPDAAALLSQPKPTALFVYLLLDKPGGLRRRDTLAAMLWPDSDQKRARGALSQTLYVIRRHLGPAVLVSRGSEDVGIAPDVVRCDALEFRRLLDAGSLEQALTLYGGELLPSFYVADTPAFEHWLETERAKLKRAAVGAAWVLADEAEAEGDVLTAGRWSRWAARVASHDEAELRRMMEMLDRLGDRSSAMAEFERYRKRLLAEMELHPESETSTLAARIAGAGKRGEGPRVPATPSLAVGVTEDVREVRDLRSRGGTVVRRMGGALVTLAVIAVLTVLGQIFSRPSAELVFGSEVPAVAVLPITGEPQLAEQVTRHLIDILQQAGFRTQGWLSVSRFVDSAGVVAEALGDRLGVEYLVDGSASLIGDRLDLSLSLVDARGGFVVWSETFIGSAADQLDFEVRAAQAIVDGVATREGQDPAAFRIRPYTRNARADSLYRAGESLALNSYNPVASRRVADTFRSAIEADPTFALAYVELAATLHLQSRVFWESEPREQMPEMLDLLLKAQQLDPELARIHSLKGWYYYGYDYDYEQALASHEQAIRLAPNQTMALMGYAFPLAALGMADSALAVMRRARELEPLNPLVGSTQCWIQYLANRIQNAIETCEIVTDSIDASFTVAHDIRDQATNILMARAGDTAGLAARLRVLEARPQQPVEERRLYLEVGDAGNAWEWATLGDTARALAILEEEKVQPHVRPLRIANGYSAAGQMDSAFVWLDRAIAARDPYVPEIAVRPEMESFRRDPRFSEYLRRLGLDTAGGKVRR